MAYRRYSTPEEHERMTDQVYEILREFDAGKLHEDDALDRMMDLLDEVAEEAFSLGRDNA